MAKSTRRWIGLSTVMAAMATVALIAILPELGRSEESRARAWASRLTDASLREAASEVGAYSMAYRKALLGRLPASERAAIWRAHILAYLNSHPSLSRQARVTLDQIAAFTEPERFQRRSPDDLAALQRLSDTLKDEIGAEEAAVVLTMRNRADIPSVRSQVTTFLRQHFELHADDPSCDCSTESDWCYASLCASYTEPGVNCTWQSWGCGNIFWYKCDGQCCLPLPEGGWSCS